MTSDQLTYMQHAEQVRSNQARESETHRSNTATETEMNRHNVAVEGETIRNNKAVLRETKRSNKANELIKTNTLGEQIRSNMASEANYRYNVDTNANIAMKKMSSDEKIARINASARVTAAQIAASASTYAADVAAQTAKYNKEMDAAIAKHTNTTKAEIAEADRLAREIENSKDRAQKAFQENGKLNNSKTSNEINSIKNDIDKAYKEGLIQKYQYDILNNFLNTGLKLGSSQAKRVTKNSLERRMKKGK